MLFQPILGHFLSADGAAIGRLKRLGLRHPWRQSETASYAAGTRPWRVEPFALMRSFACRWVRAEALLLPAEFVRTCNRHRRPRRAIRCRIRSISFGVVLFHWGEFGYVFANYLLPTSSLQRHPSSRPESPLLNQPHRYLNGDTASATVVRHPRPVQGCEETCL